MKSNSKLKYEIWNEENNENEIKQEKKIKTSNFLKIRIEESKIRRHLLRFFRFWGCTRHFRYHRTSLKTG